MRPEPAVDESVRCRVILMILWVLAVVCLIRLATARRHNLATAPVRLGIDPNRAPWWDLTLLPEIGPTTGRAIVAFRSGTENAGKYDPSSPSVFVGPGDLSRIKGIGPRTIERLGRYLRFDGPSTARVWPNESDEQP